MCWFDAHLEAQDENADNNENSHHRIYDVSFSTGVLILQHVSGVHCQGILLLLKRAGLLCKARPELICRGVCVQRSCEEEKLTLARQNTNDEKTQSSACDTRREVRRRSTQQLSLPRPPACPLCPFFGSAGAGAPLIVSLFGAIVLARACPLSRLPSLALALSRAELSTSGAPAEEGSEKKTLMQSEDVKFWSSKNVVTSPFRSFHLSSSDRLESRRSQSPSEVLA